MTLESGDRLGPYEIEAPIGEGGMGMVYRALDTRLDRTVAVKVLPPHLSLDPDARARFDREARAVSQLNHPQICALYDLGSEDDVDFLVMEYLEGETLAERLSRGPLPLAEGLRIAVGIADALAVAHREGFVHRDLKPGNVMLTKGGAKLLDFGLAKSVQAEPEGALDGLTALPTATTPLTAVGSIIGTLYYMSPEQLEGREADSRSDLFAFGAVLHEMATGRRAFGGSSQASVVAAILKEQPNPVSSVATTAPPALDRLVQRCLAKDPDDRWQSTSDLAHELRSIAADSQVMSRPVVKGPATVRANARERVAWGLVGALALGLTVVASIPLFERRPEGEGPTPVTFTVPAPESGMFRSTGEAAAPAAVSPDGRQIVFGLVEPDGRNRLWLRPLDSAEARPLAGTEGANRPFWSPDGRFIGFFTNRRLMKLEIAGGVPLPICEIEEARGGTWGPDDVIVLAPRAGSPLVRVSALGGTPKPVTTLDEEAGEGSHRYPSFLSDGRTVVFLVLSVAGRSATGTAAEQRVDAVRLDTGERTNLLVGAGNAHPAGGELLFYRGGSLMAQPLDVERLELTGQMRVVVEGIKYDAEYERGIFSAADRTLVYEAGPYRGETRLTWVDRDGEAAGTIGEVALQSAPRISPDGRRVAYVRMAGEEPSVWVADLERQRSRRVTSGQSVVLTPRWSPDGTRLAYSALSEGKVAVFVSKVDEGRTERLFGQPDADWYVTDWSQDGRRLLMAQNYFEGFFAYDLESGDGPAPVDLVEEGTAVLFGTLSPDGRWLAYSADESGQWEVYVTAFPPGESRWPVSQGSGLEPVWSPTGDSIYYRSRGGGLYETEIVVAGSSLRVGETTLLFAALLGRDEDDYDYDVSPDEERFLINAMLEKEVRIPITVEVGWRDRP